MMASLEEEIRRALEAWLRGDRGGGIVTSWFLVSEFVGPDGEHYHAMHHDEDAPVWRHIGMLEFALQRQGARTIAEEVKEED
jgi:hypothetical protein